jgi:hypothetical protein
VSRQEIFRLLYHARALLLGVAGMAGILIGVAVSHGDIGTAQLGSVAMPLLGVTMAVLAFFVWLGWIDYASATSLAIDASGVKLSGRTIPWADVRGLGRATGAFRIALRTAGGTTRFQLLVLPKPIPALKQLVTEATKAGATVEPYLARLAEHVEEDAED